MMGKLSKTRIVFFFVVVWIISLIFTIYLNIGIGTSRSTSEFISRRLIPPFLKEKGDQQPTSILCHFPNLDPFDPKILPLLKVHPTLNCNAGLPKVVDLIGDELRLNPKKLATKLNLRPVDIDCRYRSITRKPGDDYELDFGIWSKTIESSIRLRSTEEVVQVICSHSRYVVSKSYHALVRKREKRIEAKRMADYQKHVRTNSPKETLSVLFVGVDGMSKQNVIRTMPRTRKYLLNQLRAIEYKQFNKVGLNTWPNVLPLLTGLDKDGLGDWTEKMVFDSIDHLFIWNKYQRAGYRNAIMFDNAYITAFHYLKPGWKNPPFDFYPRPLVLASETDEHFREVDENCMGDSPEVTELLDYWLQLTTLYNNTPATPYFAYGFLSKLSHGYQNMASMGDELYLDFFKELDRRNVLNNTLMIFFSDHGPRFGPFMFTYNGMFEARSPMLYFVFPPWFEGKYPEVMKNVHTNAKRLMTAFDMHATLQDLLTFSGQPKRTYNFPPSAISLFSEIPANRTCKSAGIPLRFCACSIISKKNETDESISRILVSSLVRHVIRKTDQHRDKCEILHHKETLNVYVMTPDVPFESENEALYHVTVKTSPGDAIYDATIYIQKDAQKASVQGEISRLNFYKGQSECIHVRVLRDFCFCKRRIM